MHSRLSYFRLSSRATGLFLGLSSLVLGGCASIVDGKIQKVSVATSGPLEAPGAQCTLINDKGQWSVTAPGSVGVQRSFNDLVVTCVHDTAGSGTFAAKSSTKGLAFGNILLGGFIGAGIDMGTGAAYDYPSEIVVAMGSSTAVPTVAARPTAAASDAGATDAPHP